VQLGAVDRLKARLAESESRVAKTVIRAPFSGTVGLRMISPGAYVKAGADVVRLESIGTIKADFRIPELYMSKVRPSQEVVIRLDAYQGEDFRGRIYAVEPVVDERTRTVLMRARVPNKSNKLAGNVRPRRRDDGDASRRTWWCRSRRCGRRDRIILCSAWLTARRCSPKSPSATANPAK
jgi:multidrug efflux pump subunit AcrA (membrane-fusion protein)